MAHSEYIVWAVERALNRAQQQLVSAQAMEDEQGLVSLQGEGWRSEMELLTEAVELLQQKSTREKMLEFSKAFKRPVNRKIVSLTTEERLLLGKLMFEEVLEYLVDGLGLELTGKPYDPVEGEYLSERIELTVPAFSKYDPIEAADGLGDIGVVAYFNSNWHGWNLDDVIAEIHESNMSKLGENGEPIINGVTPGYACAEEVIAQYMKDHPDTPAGSIATIDDSGFDPSKPIGKILKGPNFRKPDIGKVIGVEE